MWNLKYFKSFNTIQNPACFLSVFKDNVKRNINMFCTVGKSKRVDQDLGRYSSRCRYHKIRHNYYIHSCYRIVNKGRILKISYAINGQKNGIEQKNIRLPNGWVWKEDIDGIYLTNGIAEYHPCRSNFREILAGILNVKYLIIAALKNYQKRLECELEDEFIKENANKIKVTMQDSLNAGNCEAGTISFIQREFGFIPSKEDYTAGISADQLLKTNNSAAKRAVIMAARRQMLISI